MHARCDTDPLDLATDLCEQCGGEYCDDHLVYPYGPKRPPLCKTCAIAVGGVRSGAAILRKRSRSQVKRRRKELRALEQERSRSSTEWRREEPTLEPEAPALPLELAPDLPTADPPDEQVGGRPAERRVPPWRRRRQGEADQSELVGEEPLPEPVLPGGSRVLDPTPARTSATVLLTRLRESGAVSPALERRAGQPGERSPGTEASSLAAMFPDKPVVAGIYGGRGGEERSGTPDGPVPAAWDVDVTEPLTAGDGAGRTWLLPADDVQAGRVVSGDGPDADDAPPITGDGSADGGPPANGNQMGDATASIDDDAPADLPSGPGGLLGADPDRPEPGRAPEASAARAGGGDGLRVEADADRPSGSGFGRWGAGAESGRIEIPPPPPPPPPAPSATGVPPAPVVATPPPPPVAPAAVAGHPSEVAATAVVPPALRGPLGQGRAFGALSPTADPASRHTSAASSCGIGAGEPSGLPVLRNLDQPLTARLVEAAKTNPAALDSLFGRAVIRAVTTPPAAAAPTAPVDADDHRWADVPPALRGPKAGPAR